MMDWLAPVRSQLRRLLPRAPYALREARRADAAAFSALHAASFRRGWTEDELEALLCDPAVLGHAAVAGSRVDGFILSRKAADEAEILSVAVAPASRGAGLGVRLLDLHLRRLAGLGARAVYLEVDAANEPALRLYDRAGFEQVGERPGYYRDASGRPAAALVLRRGL